MSVPMNSLRMTLEQRRDKATRSFLYLRVRWTTVFYIKKSRFILFF
jgi:hypothetical protein